MTTASGITLAGTIFLAFVGYLATHMSNRLLAQRQARLARINSQLSELYGPLLADLAIGRAAWEVFMEIAARIGPMWWDVDGEPNPHQVFLWQLWIKTVLQPTNRRMVCSVKANAALLLDNEVPDCLIRLAGNTAAYDVLAVRWDDEGFTATKRDDLVAPNRYSFPRAELEEYVRSSFIRLKTDQQDILGKLGPRGRRDRKRMQFLERNLHDSLKA